MTDMKISAMDEVTTLTNSAYFPVIDGSPYTNKRIKRANAAVALGAAMPSGGTTDQVLAKVDATDYNYYWKDDASSMATYDAVVDASGAGDYTTVGAAIAALKTNLFVRKGAYTETVWDLRRNGAGEIISIMCEGEDCVFTFSNTGGGRSCYFFCDNLTSVQITGGTFNITLNSTNYSALLGNSSMTRIFVWRNSIFNLDNDNASGRRFCETYMGIQNGFFDCRFVLLNEAKAPFTLNYYSCSFTNCTFAGGEILFGDGLFTNCDLEAVKGVGFIGGDFVGCNFANLNQVTLYDNAGGTGGTASYINSMVNSRYSFGGSITSHVGILQVKSMSNSRLDCTHAGITVNLHIFGTAWEKTFSDSYIIGASDIYIAAPTNNCYIQSTSENVYINGNDITVNGNNFSIGSGKKLYLTTNADTSVLTGNRISNANIVEVQSGCTAAVIVGNSKFNTVTDGGTSTVIANNS